jgi:hypothetical protein
VDRRGTGRRRDALLRPEGGQGEDASLRLLIERWEENRRFYFTAEAPGFCRVDAEWELVPEGEGCRFTMREQINTQAPALVDKLFVQPGATRAVRGFLAQLKSLVERHASG